MRKRLTALIWLTVLFLISCQNQLVQEIKDQLTVDEPAFTETAEGLDKEIRISSTTPGADIYYTLNNTEPKPSNPDAILYAAPLTLSGHGESLYIRTQAFKDNMDPSKENTGQFSVIYPAPYPPLLTAASGSYDDSVSLTINPNPANSDAEWPWDPENITIHYTTDGSIPTSDSPVFLPGVQNITVTPGGGQNSITTIINAICYVPGYPSSRAASGSYTVSYSSETDQPQLVFTDDDSGDPVSPGVVFGQVNASLTPPADADALYRIRLNSDDWSSWTTVSGLTDFAFFSPGDSPKDGDVITVQSYSRKDGQKDSGYLSYSFSYLVLTVPPPYQSDASFTNGSIYGADLALNLEAGDESAGIYYTTDGSIPLPETAGIAGSPTKLAAGGISGLPLNAAHEEPLFINAVAYLGGRTSAVSTFWCIIDSEAPPLPGTRTLEKSHETLTLDLTGLSLESGDVLIISYGPEGQTPTPLTYPAGHTELDDDIIILPELNNGTTYVFNAELQDSHQNTQPLFSNVERTPYTVWTTADDLSVGTLRYGLASDPRFDSGDTVSIDPALFSGSPLTFTITGPFNINKRFIFDGDLNSDGVADVIISGGNSWNDDGDGIPESGENTVNRGSVPLMEISQTISGQASVLSNVIIQDYAGENSAVQIYPQSNGDVILDRVIFRRLFNLSTGNGGAVRVNSFGTGGELQIRNSAFMQNYAGNAGAALQVVINTNASIESSVFYRNHSDAAFISAEGAGGAIWSEGTLTITHGTFVDNTSTVVGSYDSEHYQAIGFNRSAGEFNLFGSVFYNSDFTADDFMFHINAYPTGGGSSVWTIIDNQLLFYGESFDLSSWNRNGQPLLVNPDLPEGSDGEWFTEDDGLALQYFAWGNDLDSFDGAHILPAKGLEGNNWSENDLGAYQVSRSNPFRGANATVRVKYDSPENGPGADWDNAFHSIQDAVELAEEWGISEVWVARGTYYPDSHPAIYPYQIDNYDTLTFEEIQRYYHITLYPGISLYGGFAGNETSRSGSRDISANETIINGDFNNDDIPDFSDRMNPVISNQDENAYHLIRLSQGFDLSSTVIEGFTFTGGNADASENVTDQMSGIGSGIFLNGSGIILSENNFRYNKAENAPALGILDMDNQRITSPITVNSNLFYRNIAVSTADIAAGAAGFILADTVNIQDTVFQENFGYASVGAIFLKTSNAYITDTVFRGNSASLSSGAISSGDASGEMLYIANSLFEDNYSTTEGGAISTGNVNMLIENSRFLNNEAGTSGGAIYTTSGSRTIVNSLFTRNKASGGAGGGMYVNGGVNTWILNSTFYRNTSTSTGADLFQINSYLSTANSIFYAETTNLVRVALISEGASPVWDSYRNNFTDSVSQYYDTGVSYIGGGNIYGSPGFTSPTEDDFTLISGSQARNAGHYDLITEIYWGVDINYDGLMDSYPQNLPDLAGNTRIQETQVDMGAYEYSL